MSTRFALSIALALGVAAPAGVSAQTAAPEGAEEAQTIRCAVIGGLMETGFWPELAGRFEAATGHRVVVVAKGNKQEICRAFTEGEADLISMHASDMIINFVADGYGVDPQPWARNDLVFVGPAADPAGVRGMTDAGEALRKIVATGSTLLIQRSLGAQQVLGNLASSARVDLDWKHVVAFLGDPDRQMLVRAAQQNAYVLVGRVPFRNGKIPNPGLELMVEGDPRLRRPYLVVVAAPGRQADPRRGAAAAQLARYLRLPDTQEWIATYGKGLLDEGPLFFPVTVPGTPPHEGIAPR